MKDYCTYEELRRHCMGHRIEISTPSENSVGRVDIVLKCVTCDEEILRIEKPE